jgi:POT family proton-dependent oligopeptide transporter
MINLILCGFESLWLNGQHMVAEKENAGWFGHPKGLSTLFFTEMWERFSYYGMRAFLILYMIAPVTEGGLGYNNALAGRIYGIYTGSVWLATIGGGLLADWFLGQYRSVLIGGILITLGHFSLAFHALPFFFAGLSLIVIGTGLLKPNVSTIVGSLYGPEDQRRDAGFSIFYMGINVGATTGPLIAGYLAQKVDWHLGFACAGVGMTFGLIQYVLGGKRLKAAIATVAPKPKELSETKSTSLGFSSTEWKRLAAVFLFFLFAAIFWGAYEQAGSTLNIFAEKFTRLSFLGIHLVASQLQSVPAFFVIVLAPIFAWLWVKLGPREPSSPAKFALALVFVGLSFLLLVVPSKMVLSTPGLRVSVLWLIAVYFLQELGEVCLYPVGLSLVTKLAPQRIVGLMMGVWFLSISLGDIIAGSLTAYMDKHMVQLFTGVGMATIAAAVMLSFLIKPLRKLMGGVH